jgi:hypothetical protein
MVFFMAHSESEDYSRICGSSMVREGYDFGVVIRPPAAGKHAIHWPRAQFMKTLIAA